MAAKEERRIEALKLAERIREDKRKSKELLSEQRKAYADYLEAQTKKNAEGRARADEERNQGIEWDDPEYRAELENTEVAESGEKHKDPRYAMGREEAVASSDEAYGGKKIRVYDKDSDDKGTYYARARVMKDPEDIGRVVGKVDRTYTESEPGVLQEVTVKGVSGGEVQKRAEEYLRYHPEEATAVEKDATGEKQRDLTRSIRKELLDEVKATDAAYERWKEENPHLVKKMSEEDLAEKYEEIRSNREFERRIGNLDQEREYIFRRYAERRAEIEAEIRRQFEEKGKELTTHDFAQLESVISGDEEIRLLEMQSYNLGKLAERYEQWESDGRQGAFRNYLAGIGGSVIEFLANPFGLTETMTQTVPLMHIKSKLNDGARIDELTQDEVLALESYFLRTEGDARTKMSLARSSGEFTGALLEIAAEFGLNPASGITRATLSRMVAEVGKDGAMSLIRKSSKLARMLGYKGVDVGGLQVARNLGKVTAAALGEGAAMSVSTQGLKNLNAAAGRIQAERGDYGELTGVGGESEGKAIAKTFTGSALTNAAFVFPATFGAKAMRGFDNAARALHVPFGNPVDAFVKMKSGEAMSILSAEALGRSDLDQTWRDFADPEKNGELIAGLLASELTMGAMRGGAGQIQGGLLRHNRSKARTQLMREAARGARAFAGEEGSNRLHDWESIVRAIYEGDEETILDALSRAARDPQMTRDQKEAVLDYARAAYRYIGAERGYEEWRTRGERERAAREQEEEWNIVDPVGEEMRDESYESGYGGMETALTWRAAETELASSGDASGHGGDGTETGQASPRGASGHSEKGTGTETVAGPSEHMQDIAGHFRKAREDFEEAFEDPEYWLSAVEEEGLSVSEWETLSEAQQGVLIDYLNSREALRGALDAMENHAEGQRQDIEREVKHRTHTDSGKIVPAVMKVNDRPVYIIKGDVAMFADGSGVDARNSTGSIVVMDAESGKYEFTSPEQILRVGETIDPETELRSAYEAIDRDQEAIISAATEEAEQASPRGADGTEAEAAFPRGASGHSENGDGAAGTPRGASGHSGDGTETEGDPGVPNIGENTEISTENRDLATENVANSVNSVENVQQTALSRIPIDEETGEPVFEAVDAETAWDGLVEAMEGESNALPIAQQMIENANKKLEALNKKPPIFEKPKLAGKAGPMAMRAEQKRVEKANERAQADYQQALADAQAEAQAWSNILSVFTNRNAELRRQQEEARRQRDAEAHDAAVASFEEEQRIKAEKQAEQERIGIHAVNPKIKEKWDASPKVDGHPDVITLPDGSTLTGHYVMTEAGAASASHDVNNAFEPTEGFPIDKNGQSVNDRDYKRDRDAQHIVHNMANAYDSRAMQTPVIVSNDGIVLSGNNRTMSGDMAATQGTDGAYLEYLSKYGRKYGFTPEQVQGMKHPRVVFVPDEDLPYNANTFSRFNAQEMKSQSKPEAAIKLGKIVDDATFNRIVDDLNKYDRLSDFYINQEAAARTLGELVAAGAINDKQLPELRTGTALSAAGKELIENTLIGKVFQTSPDAVLQIISMPTLRESIVMGLSEIASNRTLAKKGYDLSKELANAVDLVYRAKTTQPKIYKEGMPVSPFGRMQGLFDDNRVTDAATLLLADLLNSAKPTDVRKVLALYNAKAQKGASGQYYISEAGDMMPPMTKNEVLTIVNELFSNGTAREKQELVDAAIADRKQRASAQPAGRRGGTAAEQAADAGRRGEGSEGRAGGAAAEISKTNKRATVNPVDMPENEKERRGELLRNATAIEVKRGQIVATKDLSARKAAERWWDENVGEPALYDTEVGEVEINRNSVESSLAHKYGQMKLDAITSLADGFENAVYLGTMPDFSRQEGVSNHFFAYPIIYDGKRCYVFCRAMQDANKNRLYVHEVFVEDRIKKGDTLQTAASQPHGGIALYRDILANVLETVAKTEPQQPNNAVSSDSSLPAGEQSGKSSAEPNGKSTVSDGKGNTLLSDKQGKGAESSLVGRIAKAEATVNTEPTEAQKEAGNYRKGHVNVEGFDVTIEQPKGSIRRGKDADGNPWESKMNNTYGYIRGTESVDGDHIDVFLSDTPEEGNVYVVDQYEPDGTFDEHKVMYGFPDAEAARTAYLSNYEEGWDKTRRIDVTGVSKEGFKKWIGSSRRKTKPFAEYKSVKALTEEADQTRTNINKEGIVIDGEGKPLTLYHGTPNKEVTSVSQLEPGHKRMGEETPARYNGDGVSFSPEMSVAQDYAAEVGHGKGRIFPANIRLTNPYYTLGVANFTPEEAAEFTAGLKAKGHDGIINYSSASMREAGALPAEVIVFNNSAILPIVDNDLDGVGYTITPTEYQGKKKKTPVWVVKFDRNLSNEDKRALVAYMKEPLAEGKKTSRGWLDKASGEFYMRSEEAAEGLARMLDNPEAVADAQPLSAEDYKEAAFSGAEAPARNQDGRGDVAAREIGQGMPMNRVSVEGLFNDLSTKGETKLSDHSAPAKPESAPAKPEPKQKPRLVRDEEMRNLENELRDLLGIDDSEGDRGDLFRDPEDYTTAEKIKIISVGTTYAFKYFDQGIIEFPDFAALMVRSLGEKIRPWIKSFYNGAQSAPGYDHLPFTPADEVKAFDIMNFDKAEKDTDPMRTAQGIVAESRAEAAADEARKEITEQRNQKRKKDDKQREADTETIASKGETVAGKAESLAETSADRATLSKVSGEIDKATDKVNDQLALLGYYEADGDMAKAEAKAARAGAELGVRLMEDMGFAVSDLPKDTELSKSNFHAGGGFVKINLPISKGYEPIQVEIRFDRVKDKSLRLSTVTIVTKRGNPDSYISGEDRKVWMTAPTYGELLNTIREQIGEILPNSETSKGLLDIDGVSEFREKILSAKGNGITIFEETTSTDGTLRGLRIGNRKSATVYWEDQLTGELGRMDLAESEKQLREYEREHEKNERLSKVSDSSDFWEYLKSIGEANPERGVSGYDIKEWVKQAKEALEAESYYREVFIPLLKILNGTGEAKRVVTQYEADQKTSLTGESKTPRGASGHGNDETPRGASGHSGEKKKPAKKKQEIKPEQPVGDLFAGLLDNQEPETVKKNEKREGNKSGQGMAGGKLAHTVGPDAPRTDGGLPPAGIEPTHRGGSADAEGSGVERGTHGATHGTDADGRLQSRLGDRGRDEGDADSGSSGTAVERRGTTGEGTVSKRGADRGGEGLSEGEPASKSGRGSRTPSVNKPKKPEVRYSRNFRYDEKEGNEADIYTPSQRLEANVNAIETLAEVLFDNKPATEEQRAVMSRFRGWGQVELGKYYSIDHILRDTYSSNPLNRLAKAIQKLDPQGDKKLFDAIKRASLSSYYTPTPIARAMNTFLGLAGYKGGSLLDPSMGNGMYEGTLPKSIQERTAITGVELDWLSGQLSRQLYPEANVIIGGFEKSGIAPGSFDVVTSNVPFGDIVVNDPSWKNDGSPVKRSAQNRIHNYYSVKMLEAARPGGLVAMLTTSAVMDTPSNQNIRAHIADQGEILGAIRLPDNTFQGTGVVTDILFIRKWRDDQDRAQTREDAAYKELEQAFLSHFEKTVPNKLDGKKEKVQLNGYFEKNPRNLIGEVQAGNQYGKRDAFGLTSKLSVEEIASEIEKAIKRIVGNRRGSLFNPTRTIR